MKKTIIIIFILIVLSVISYVVYMESASSTKQDVNVVQEISTVYSIEDVSKHNKSEDCWIAINGKIYDTTNFIKSGGHNDKILNGCGKDATEMFSNIPKHASKKAQDALQMQFIGLLK